MTQNMVYVGKCSMCTERNGYSAVGSSWLMMLLKSPLSFLTSVCLFFSPRERGPEIMIRFSLQFCPVLLRVLKRWNEGNI